MKIAQLLLRAALSSSLVVVYFYAQVVKTVPKMLYHPPFWKIFAMSKKKYEMCNISLTF
jgi:hypothetical protein